MRTDDEAGGTPPRAVRLPRPGRPRETALRTVLVLARGYGGFNSALVVTRAD
ncbi:hypothetical protein [Streptomyces sp. NBC_00996]|uniref:hypothetical protein n=1 Tax=Streptomyces sp. NBC_00996 TaxID=2903710 RepID=UPI00386A6667|nr:hypothetical protein OG390_15045 [Streptomyces sp. NBC_00996]